MKDDGLDHKGLSVLSLCGLILNNLDMNTETYFCDDLGMTEV